MAIAGEPGMDVAALRELVLEHRRILDELEGLLAAQAADEEPLPDNVIPLAAGGRAARMARNEARRAARRAESTPEEGLWVALPSRPEVVYSDRDAQLAEVGGARRQVWRRSQEIAGLLRNGQIDVARIALEDILRTELAIQAVIDSIELPLVWHSVAGELTRASDVIIDTARDLIGALPRYEQEHLAFTDTIARMVTAQSNWSRAWRTFVQVVPAQPR